MAGIFVGGIVGGISGSYLGPVGAFAGASAGAKAGWDAGGKIASCWTDCADEAKKTGEKAKKTVDNVNAMMKWLTPMLGGGIATVVSYIQLESKLLDFSNDSLHSIIWKTVYVAGSISFFAGGYIMICQPYSKKK